MRGYKGDSESLEMSRKKQAKRPMNIDLKELKIKFKIGKATISIEIKW